IAAVWLLWLESLFLHLHMIGPINAWLLQHRLPVINADLVDYEPKRLFMRSVYLIVMGLLLGYLAEQQKKLRAERDEASKMLGMVSIEAGLAGTLAQIVGEMLRLYRASEALVASREGGTQRISVGKILLRQGQPELNWMEPGPSGAQTYLAKPNAVACYAES